MPTISTQRQKLHPHKMLLWIAIASMCMMFAGWTSAFLVRKAQGNWLIFKVPTAFWISSIVIILSSITIHLAIKEFKKRNISLYKTLISTTALLGFIFMILQFVGFFQMHKSGITLASNGDGVSGSFIYVISGIHLLHMLGGVIALIITFFVVNFRRKTKVYTSNGLEILATYWHFVDILWIYLFLFFIINS
ncbi:MAG: cytochrome c oxidase subunit 3 [Chitinophagaceae bacterium]|nr:MAG: cytochrome C oxidase subunit III [Bacteroidetes bacterium OLB11]MCC6447944.1 cytochrome c oxidase subunit 3 [Chitinophagaceae bacterium]HMN32369.1 cytochrome c oxidase subunit 3 [Chitinophagaceae bacterium]